MRCKSLIIFGLGVSFLIASSVGWAQRRNRRQKPVNDDIYNEIIDERSDDEKKTESQRFRELRDELRKQKSGEASPEGSSINAPVPISDGPPPANNLPPRRIPPRPSDAPGSLPVDKVKLDNRPTLGIYPASPTMYVGQETEFEVRLDNPDKVNFDALAFAIKYDPYAFRVIDQKEGLSGVNIDDTSAAVLGLNTDKQDKFYRNEVDMSEGIILFQALAGPEKKIAANDGVVGKFTIRAMQERGSVSMDMLNVLEGAALKKITTANDRTPATFLRMYDRNDSSKLLEYPVLQFGSKARVLLADDKAEESMVDFYPTSMRLVADSDKVSVGQEFDVLVMFDNKQHISIDAVSLLLRYDPRVLRVIDSDEGNFITDGVNISDGQYHDKFPFDYCKANRVEEEQGRILYSMGSASESINASGPFARIRFEALREVKKTYLLYGISPFGKFPTTGVFRRKQDMLAGTSDSRDGIYRCGISILQ